MDAQRYCGNTTIFRTTNKWKMKEKWGKGMKKAVENNGLQRTLTESRKFLRLLLSWNKGTL